jgi:hypothetical protein
MGEPGRIQAFLGWWRELPTGWRVNVGLYVLAGVSLIALLTQMVVGGDSGPRRVEVAAGRRAPARSTTTAVPPSSTLSPTSTVPPLTTAPPATTPKSPVTTRAFTGGKPAGGGGGGGPAVTFAPTTAPPVECGRNSTDDRCGPLVWDPDPGPNAGINITVDGPTTVAANEPVTYTVRATDPDHLMTRQCTRADFGDGAVREEPCNPPPCVNARGVWDTPPKQTGNGEITYQHTFKVPGTYTMRFTFHTDKDRCPDPYGSVATESVIVTVTA